MAGGPHLFDSVRQEALALTRLLSAGIAVPRVDAVATAESAGAAPFFTMEHVVDNDLGCAIIGRLGWAEESCRRAGEFLAGLHQLPVSLVDGFVPQHSPITKRINWTHWTLIGAWERTDASFRAALETARIRINDQLREPGNAVVHDSFIASHVLTDGAHAFAVNDWETIRVGYPSATWPASSPASRRG